MPLPATTAHRVPRNAASGIDTRIRQETDARIADLSKRGPWAIRERLAELDREWDVERFLETGAASLTLMGTVLGAAVDRKWLWLPGVVAAFLLQHAVRGWCPPLPLLRRLGVRTAGEIDRERTALQRLR